tara:strand:- start:9 stop:1844 length:1836 start_codon:yes stop_codon:yes gene_type:complete
MNSNLVSLVPINGTEFSVQRSNKIIFELNGGDLAFIKGRDSYLTLDILNNSQVGGNPVRFTPNMMAGSSSIIQRIDCYSLLNGQHLSTCDNYNKWCAIENSYFYNDINNLQALEGCGHIVKAREAFNGVVDTAVPQSDKLEDNILSQMKTDGNAVFGYHRYTVPLRLPLWRWFDDERLCPNLFLGGVRMEIFLEDPKVAFQYIAGIVSDERSIPAVQEKIDPIHGAFLPPVSNGYQYTSAGHGIPIRGTTTDITAIPFAVGSKVSCNGTATTVSSFALQTNTFSTPVAFNNLAGAGDTITKGGDQTGQSFFDNANAGDVFLVKYTETADGITKQKYLQLKAKAVDGTPNSTFQFEGGATVLPIATAISITRPSVVYVKVADNIAAFGADSDAKKLALTSDNRVAQVKPLLKVMTVAVPENVGNLSKGMNYQFTGWDNFINTLPASTLRHQQDVNSVASKAVAMNSHYHNNGTTQSALFSSYFTGSTPTELNLNGIQYFINNKLYPVQSYNPQPKQEKVVNENENVKALSTINKEPKNLGTTKGIELESYTNPYIHSRELARGDFVFNLRDAEPQIRTDYSADRGSVNTSIDTFVWSKKIINVSENGLQIIL